MKQDPPNSGTLLPIGDLGIDTASVVGFDIRTIAGSDPALPTNIAYASLTEQRGNGATQATLYHVDLATGAATTLGTIGGPKTLDDIAAAL